MIPRQYYSEYRVALISKIMGGKFYLFYYDWGYLVYMGHMLNSLA